MKTEKINITGMTCGHCIQAVMTELTKLNLKIKNIEIGSAEVEYEELKIKREQINKAIEEAGYEVK